MKTFTLRMNSAASPVRCFLGIVASVIAITTLAALPGSASPIDYTLSGVTATFGPGSFTSGGTDDLTGSFTWDPLTDGLSAISVTVTGAVLPGSFDVPNSGFEGPPVTAIEGQVGGPGTNILELIFDNPLGNVPDPLNYIVIVATPGSARSEAATGYAVPATTPEPASLPVLSAALGVLFLAHWRRRAGTPSRRF
jgi:hypothetical protein